MKGSRRLSSAGSSALAVVAGWSVCLPALLLGLLTADCRGQIPPNVVLIVADDLGGSDLGCYGSRYHQTPHLDLLAADGLRFTQAYAASPVCSPTRAALLTGQNPARIGLTDWLPGRPDRPDQPLLRPELPQQLPLATKTLAELFRLEGYATAHIGKWHLGGTDFGPRDQGFDTNIGGDASGTPLSYVAPFRFGDQVMRGLDQAPEDQYLTDRLTDEAVKFIDLNRNRPFFLYLPHYAPHIPLIARSDLEQKWATRDRPKAPGAQSNPTYAAMLESIDDSVGRIREALAQAGMTEQTIILFTSDNGGLATAEGPNTPATSNAPFREGKGHLYEGGIRVPLIAAWPGSWKPGRTVDTAVISQDLLPTLAAICRLQSPNELDGFSLLPLREGSATLPQRNLYWHYPHYSNQRGRPSGAIRQGSFKLIEFFETGRQELFDLSKDVSESQNLAEQFPDVVANLSRELAAWRTEVGATQMKPNPDFVPNPQGANGVVLLPARSATVHGVMLRYEPLPHKETLGFWVRESDWADWEFTVKKPGRFSLQILQGCGPGSGGSEVEFAIGDQTTTVTVEETKGFQDFKLRTIGEVKLDNPGRYTLTVKPLKKPGVAVMDLREVRLTPKR